MTDVHIELSETATVPDDATIEYAVNGDPIGFRLADGRLLRPFIVYELEEDDGETVTDLGTLELQAIGVEAGEDLRRRFEEVDDDNTGARR